MEPVKEGDRLVCSECSVELEVVKSCGCSDCVIECCGKPMEVKQNPSGGCCCC
jgi:hypothetical protein